MLDGSTQGDPTVLNCLFSGTLLRYLPGWLAGANDNTMSIDENTSVDVPPEWASTEKYSASLGHKVNHSFTPNARFEPFIHPRFGTIKCIRAVNPVRAGEEITCHYDYHVFDEDGELAAPAWYKELDACKGSVPPTYVCKFTATIRRRINDGVHATSDGRLPTLKDPLLVFQTGFFEGWCVSEAGCCETNHHEHTYSSTLTLDRYTFPLARRLGRA